ncbi:MAG: methyltransferase [Treponema sp.]|nr:methyltransferase [Candidatus Treponema merdequi]
MTPSSSRYYRIMNTSVSLKSEIPDYVVGERILDVGSGGGVMLDALEKKFGDTKTVIGTEISPIAIEYLTEKKLENKSHWTLDKHNFVDGSYPIKVDTIIFSSILHEIYSYTVTNGRKFNLASVTKALDNAYDSLNPGGRIIIRDGVKSPDYKEIKSVTVRTEEGIEFFNRFIKDFKGFPTLPRDFNIEDRTITGPFGILQEFIFKYDWGPISYDREIHEQFGYLTNTAYNEILESMGFTVAASRAYFEDGYREFLDKIFENYPKFDTNQFIIADKL